MKENLPRILIGLLALFLIGQMVGQVATYVYPSFEPSDDDLLSDIDSYVFRASAIAYTFAFFATVIGGFIARAKFVVPAAIYASVSWTYGVYLGNPTQISYLFSPALIAALMIGIAVAVVGSLAGMRLYSNLRARRIEAQ